MSLLINAQRPPAFCPGCTHERVVGVLGQALDAMGVSAPQVAIVSDIGCSGLFDTFFHTHALHGLHGRALTYATGLKLAQPELTVVVTMGDGGLGIGGAHLLSACRRNLDITLLVLNNFNYGMTGGQCSATTPTDASTASGFLNELEHPMDVCQVAASAGAPYVYRVSSFQKDLTGRIKQAIGCDGFALMDIWGICPGRYTRANPLSPKQIDSRIAAMPEFGGAVAQNQRQEFGAQYRLVAARQPQVPEPLSIQASHEKRFSGRREVLLLGRAGQRIKTAGEILCMAAMASGLYATQKDDYPITVLRGHSISEVVLSDTPVGYSGLEEPGVVIALAADGVSRRRAFFESLGSQTLVIVAPGVDLPDTQATVMAVDYKSHGIRASDWALASLAALAVQRSIITPEMLRAAIDYRFSGPIQVAAQNVIDAMVGSLNK